jgi:hypothetical protein
MSEPEVSQIDRQNGQFVSEAPANPFAQCLGNDISKAIDVGEWTAIASPTGGVTVTYSLDPGFFVTEVHVDLECLPIDTCAPGQYTFNSGALPNVPVFSNPTPIPYPTCSGGSVAYLILHAAITQTTTATECPPPKAT